MILLPDHHRLLKDEVAVCRKLKALWNCRQLWKWEDIVGKQCFLHRVKCVQILKTGKWLIDKVVLHHPPVCVCVCTYVPIYPCKGVLIELIHVNSPWFDYKQPFDVENFGIRDTVSLVEHGSSGYQYQRPPSLPAHCIIVRDDSADDPLRHLGKVFGTSNFTICEMLDGRREVG